MARLSRLLDVSVPLAPGVPACPRHLAEAIVIIEGPDLTEDEPGTCELYCLPLRIAGADGGPVRVVLKR